MLWVIFSVFRHACDGCSPLTFAATVSRSAIGISLAVFGFSGLSRDFFERGRGRLPAIAALGSKGANRKKPGSLGYRASLLGSERASGLKRRYAQPMPRRFNYEVRNGVPGRCPK